MTRDELIEKVAREIESSDVADYDWSDIEFDTWWYYDKRNKKHDRQKERAAAASPLAPEK